MYSWPFIVAPRPTIWVCPKIEVFPPKWMVKIMEKPYEQMDDVGGKPPIFGNIH